MSDLLDKTISGLPFANGATLADTDKIPVVCGGITSYIDISGLLARIGVVGALGEANTASNVGTGIQLFKEKIGIDLSFKTLIAGAGISLGESTNAVTISNTGGGGSSFTGGDVPNPIKVWRSAGASTRALDTPAFRVADTGGITTRTVSMFGDESIIQIGPTPTASQWSEASGAPSGSSGPIRKTQNQSSLYIINGPVGGDAHEYMVANASLTGGAADSGPNQQSTGMGSVGKIRINMKYARSDGGYVDQSNTYAGIAPTPAGETVSLAGTTATFSVDMRGKIAVGDAFWLLLQPAPYSADTFYNDPSLSAAGTGGTSQTRLAGFTLFSLDPATGLTGTYTASQTIDGTQAGPITAYSLGTQPADRKRGQVKWGIDSASDFFGLQYTQPADSTHAAVNHIGDYNLLIYPGGIIGRTDSGTDKMGFTTYADVVVKQPSRSLRFGTSGELTNGDYKAAITIGFHYSTDAAGTTITHGQLRAQGGSNDARSSFYMLPQAAAPDSFVGGGGDMWTDGTTVYFRNAAGTTKSFVFA